MNLKLKVPGSQKKNEWFNAINVYTDNSAVLGVISLTGGDNFDAQRAGGFIQKQLESSLVSKISEFSDYSLWLRAAIKDSRDRLLRLVEFDQNVKIELIDLSIVLICPLDDVLYIAKVQGTGIYIKRGEEYINLSNRLEDPKGLNQIFVGSGILETGDMILISTKYSSETDLPGEYRSVFREDIFDKAMLCLGYGDAHVSLKDLGVGANEDAHISENEDFENSEFIEDLNPNELSGSAEVDDSILEGQGEVATEEKTDLANKASIIDKLKVVIASLIVIIKSLILKIKAKFIKKDKTMSGDNSQFELRDERAEETSDEELKKEYQNEKTYVYLLAKLKRKLVNLSSKFTSLLKGFKSPKGRKIHLRGTGKKLPLKHIVAVLLLIVIAIYFGGKKIAEKRNDDKTKAIYEQHLSSADDNISKAKEVSAINKTRAKSYLSDSVVSLEKALSMGIDKEKVEKKKTEVLGLMDELDGIKPVTGIEIVFDSINSFESDGVIDFTILGNKAYVLDSKKRNIYVLDLETKQSTKLFDDGKLDEPKYIEALSNGNLALYDGENGLMVIDTNLKTINKQAGLSPSTIGLTVELENFIIDKSDTLYTLRPDVSKIDKLTKSGDNFSAPQTRLTGPELSTAKDIAIDGNIYVLTSASPGVVRYYTGKKVETKISKEDISTEGFIAFDLNQNTVNMYVLDKTGKQIIKLAKPTKELPNTLEVKEQLVYRGDKNLFSDFKEVIVNSEESKLYVLDGSRILEIPLK